MTTGPAQVKPRWATSDHTVTAPRRPGNDRTELPGSFGRTMLGCRTLRAAGFVPIARPPWVRSAQTFNSQAMRRVLGFIWMARRSGSVVRTALRGSVSARVRSGPACRSGSFVLTPYRVGSVSARVRSDPPESLGFVRTGQGPAARVGFVRPRSADSAHHCAGAWVRSSARVTSPAAPSLDIAFGFIRIARRLGFLRAHG
jgi:hypothetical protein